MSNLLDNAVMGGRSVTGGSERSELPTGTVTLLLSDLEHSTTLWEEVPDEASAVIARQYALIDTAVDLHGGVRPQEQGEGDSVVAAFTSPSRAVAAALDIQLAFAAEAWPVDRPVRVRIALHTGEIALRDRSNYEGPTIIRCARLRDVAHGGQTVLSASTCDIVADLLPDGATIRDLGRHRLKDLARAERVGQLCHADLADDFGPLRSLDAAINNLPSPTTRLIGRSDEVAEVLHLLSAERLVTLTGAGGCGKTRLALQAAAESAESHPDGVWWVELATVTDPTMVDRAIAGAMGIHEDHDEPLVDTIVGQLSGRRVLLVLDNCENQIDRVVALTDELLGRADGLRVLTTSREALGLTGEVVWRVPSLGERAATELFVERATQTRPSFDPDEEALVDIDQVCRRLDRLPLAIELAAARVRMMSPAAISAALDDRFRLLTGGTRGAIPRQQTLEASVAWSHDLLEEPERVVLRRLSVFAGGFTLATAEGVTSDADAIVEADVFDIVARLADRSLVQVDHDDDATRYRLLETVRAFARERLVESGESESCRDRHLASFLGLAEQIEPKVSGPEGLRTLATLEREHDNLRAGLEWAETQHDVQRFLRLATALTLFWELRGHLGEATQWFARGLAMDPEPSGVTARSLWGAGHVALYHDDFNGSRELATAALEMATTFDDDWARARALNTLGYAGALLSEPGARQQLDESIAIGRELDDRWVVADGIKMAMTDCLVRDDHDEMDRLRLDLAVEARQMGNSFFLAWCDAIEGQVAARRGQIEVARLALRRSIERCADIGDPATGGFAQVWLAGTQILAGEHDAARVSLEEFRSRATASGGHIALGSAILELGDLLVGCADPDALAVGELISSAFTVPVMIAWGWSVASAARLADGDVDGARAALASARRHAAPVGNQWLSARIDRLAASVARLEGELGEAHDAAHASLSQCMSAGMIPGVLDTLDVMATIHGDRENWVEVARITGGCSPIRAEMGLARYPAQESMAEASVAAARDALGDDGFDLAWSEGAALGLDDLVTRVTGARGERRRPSSGWASLTPTEERAVGFVAEGLTNREIGERMFIAAGTVKVHLAHVFAKVGVTTRSQLAAQAATRLARRSEP